MKFQKKGMVVMNTEYLIIEKEYGNHIMPHKPKPLCSCFIGDKMVDMYARFNFDEKYVIWNKAYKGHTHEKSCFDNISVYDGNDDEINKAINAIDEYFKHHQLYLH